MATVIANAGISVAALTIIVVVALVVVAAIGVIAFKLQREVKMPPVSVYSLELPNRATTLVSHIDVLHKC